jgi:xylan 1,4-beta-xylosidase
MNLMGDSLAVLGSRLGVAWDPANKKSYLIRHGEHPGIPLGIAAGIEIGGRTIMMPLTDNGGYFEFMDQDTTPTTMAMSGIDPGTGLHVKLTVTIPFRPRDSVFSTIPVVCFNLAIDRISSSFRWTPQQEGRIEGKLFLAFHGDGFDIKRDTDGYQVNYKSIVKPPRRIAAQREDIRIDCTDRIVIISGEPSASGVEKSFSLDRGEVGETISLAWCAWDEPVLDVLGEKCPFKYAETFDDLKSVVSWTKDNYQAIIENSEKVDRIILGHNLGESISRLLSYTLHAWLINTWYVVRPNGQQWFTVWEGSCNFHSTVDVEYTQTPFYLAVWPELLGLELEEWPFFYKSGEEVLGELGKDTVFLCHDMGQLADCTRQFYSHHMEVEENTNYILMAYTHWRRTGDDSKVKKYAGFIKKLLDFVVACDSTGNGIPDKGCANTIDDASPAIQYGSKQVYLGVKAMCACRFGSLMLKHADRNCDIDKYIDFAHKAKLTLEEEGWIKDHYAVTLTKTMDGLKDPWSGKELHGELKGWDAYHIYTVNGLTLLDMVGADDLLTDERICEDIKNGIKNTVGRYGCRHTSYIDKSGAASLIQGLAATARKTGWVSMNMLRDISAAYRGIDALSMADRYWEWQCTTNSQQYLSFFETFYGNNLNFYPRGIAVYGYFDAAAGFKYDVVEGINKTSPLRSAMEVPLLLFANWKEGTVPIVRK